MPTVAGVSLKSQAEIAFKTLMNTGAGAIRYVKGGIAFIITFGIVYNAARIAYAERSRLILTAATVLLVGVALAVAFWPKPTMVDMGTVSVGTMQLTIDEEGRTRVRDAYIVSTPVAGQLQRISVQPGDPVVRSETIVAHMRQINPAALGVRTRKHAQDTVDALDAGGVYGDLTKLCAPPAAGGCGPQPAAFRALPAHGHRDVRHGALRLAAPHAALGQQGTGHHFGYQPVGFSGDVIDEHATLDSGKTWRAACGGARDAGAAHGVLCRLHRVSRHRDALYRRWSPRFLLIWQMPLSSAFL